MAQINLDVFNGKDLQNMIQLLNLFESIGLTDIRFVRQRLYEAMHIINLQLKVDFLKIEKQEVRSKSRLKKITCPVCKNGFLLPIVNDEGLNIVGCKKCRYSEIREENNVK